MSWKRSQKWHPRKIFNPQAVGWDSKVFFNMSGFLEDILQSTSSKMSWTWSSVPKLNSFTFPLIINMSHIIWVIFINFFIVKRSSNIFKESNRNNSDSFEVKMNGSQPSILNYQIQKMNFLLFFLFTVLEDCVVWMSTVMMTWFWNAIFVSFLWMIFFFFYPKISLFD